MQLNKNITIKINLECHPLTIIDEMFICITSWKKKEKLSLLFKQQCSLILDQLRIFTGKIFFRKSAKLKTHKKKRYIHRRKINSI